MKQVITDRYEPKEKDVAYRCQFRYRKQEKGGSVSDYGYQLNRLARKAFPNLTLSQLETHVIDQFITGIGNYELQKHVQFGHPKSINAAIGLATEYEALDGSADRVRKPHAGTEHIAPIVPTGYDVQQNITLDQIDKLIDKKINFLSLEGRYRNKIQALHDLLRIKSQASIKRHPQLRQNQKIKLLSSSAIIVKNSIIL